ncbi:MAG: Undecaprenyl-phosphate 4-deoxy-4-formamido-L-arabinose transferase [Verrucomicrobia bacterium ADurb.Bin018]|jgi:glycosyltransferase involved in cell wall biosynthesis|nr:MAG: Undecaprenyl-phosphate 4-deoxy-4-formamido-L-arabinose transferase [Verrucomicrobia bacterium ADurb.Bin018]
MSDIELSVVMPCLNEADTLEACIRKARAALREQGISGEVIVADNGSTDASPQIAERCGARLIRVPQHANPQRNGYGNGLMTGIAAAHGRYVLMGDSDASYDFGEIPRFLDKLREGFDLVMGCRLPAGGGRILKGAMPWSHRWIGNPLFSLLVRRWFGVAITDVNCGMRAFRKEWHRSIDQRCTGMEFAAEMIIKAGLFHANIAEVPITLAPDGRQSRAPHLKTFRDGWRILRHLFIYSPSWLYLFPGLSLILAGAAGGALALFGAKIGRATFDAHTLLFSSVFILCGYQAVLYSILAKTFAINEGLMPPAPWFAGFYRVFTLERGLILGALGVLAGFLCAGWALWTWAQADFGALSYARMMRVAIPGALFMVLGFQTVFSSFFGSVLGMGKR